VNLLNPPRLDKTAVKKSFNRSAAQYNQSAILQREVLTRLFERLQYIKLAPKLVVDLGCGTGQAIKMLRKHYAKSSILGLDLAHEMLSISKKQFGLFDRKWLINADMEQLPLAEGKVDLIFSSLALQWSNDLVKTFQEFKRVGREGGLVMFTTFGVNTLHELRQSWQEIDPSPRVHQFLDMHDIGDMMMSSRLSQPVLDMEDITLEYDRFEDLLRDLKSIGATNAERGRSRGLMTPKKLARLKAAYEDIAFKDGRYTATYEIVYGHAWF
jgi:malonyl-CoA O-methyltransferase